MNIVLDLFDELHDTFYLGTLPRPTATEEVDLLQIFRQEEMTNVSQVFGLGDLELLLIDLELLDFHVMAMKNLENI